MRRSGFFYLNDSNHKEYKDIQPLDIGEEICAPCHSFGPAVRRNWLLHFVVSGKGRFVSPRGEYELSAGDTFVIRPYEVCYYEADEKEPWHYLWVGFAADRELPTALTSHDVLRISALRAAFMPISSAQLGAGNGGVSELALSVTYSVLSTLFQRESGGSLSKEEYVASAVRIMESEYAQGISVSDIADRLHVNRQYLQTLFKEVCANTPAEHLRSLRMRRACELLEAGDYTIAVVATSVGYSDAFVFSRAFKQYVGTSPSAYRLARAKGR